MLSGEVSLSLSTSREHLREISSRAAQLIVFQVEESRDQPGTMQSDHKLSQPAFRPQDTVPQWGKLRHPGFTQHQVSVRREAAHILCGAVRANRCRRFYPSEPNARLPMMKRLIIIVFASVALVAAAIAMRLARPGGAGLRAG